MIIYSFEICFLGQIKHLCFSKTSQRNKQVAMGRKKFNMDPKKVRTCFKNKRRPHGRSSGRSVLSDFLCRMWRASFSELWNLSFPIISRCFSSPQGIQFMLENDLLQNTPEDIAQFLYKGEGLNKTVIGDYLGERWGVCHDGRNDPPYMRLTLVFGIKTGKDGFSNSWRQ